MNIKQLYYFLCLVLGLAACTADSDNQAAESGKGGSMARFAIKGDYLYTVDNFQLKVFGISNPQSPDFKSSVGLGNDIETIFPYQNHIFIGSQTGMLILDNSNPEQPTLLSTYSHVRRCDPVVVQGNYAYVTLRSGGTVCWGGTNTLEVINISNLQNPVLEASYPMDSPYGLGIDGKNLFVCDGGSGLKFFDATDPVKLTLSKQINNLDAYDVIPWRNHLLMVGKNGFYQYTYEGNLVSSMLIGN
ncbi:MAG: hypothetical protein MUE85_00720 [Microscillaceae bacterium]|jgi:hypothetical protein|nr:hypothetical protein [Microscillaceae bacterium]